MDAAVASVIVAAIAAVGTIVGTIISEVRKLRSENRADHGDVTHRLDKMAAVNTAEHTIIREDLARQEARLDRHLEGPAPGH